MQVGAVLVLEVGPLGLRNGGIDIERVRAYTEERLSRAPRGRQRALELVLGRLPTWVDDPFFDLAYHVRHVALPRPGDERQLKRLASRVFSEALDPEKPLWELWVVEGLEDGRFALIAKADSALVSGNEGFDPVASIVGSSPDEAFATAPRLEVQPAPGRIALMRAELARRAREIARPESVGAALSHGLRGALNALERALASRSDLPLTGPAGSHRRIEILALDLSDLQDLAGVLGAKREAVLLSTLAGALRVFLARRGHESSSAGLRVLTPIGVGLDGSEVEAPLVELPVFEPDPLRRIDALATAPEPQVGSASSLSVLRDLARLQAAAASGRPASLCVTALSTPETPLFLLGAPVRTCVAIPELLSGHTLGITATFFDGRVMLGFSGDAVLASDLPLLADSFAASFDELRRHASGSVHRSGSRTDQAEMREIGA